MLGEVLAQVTPLGARVRTYRMLADLAGTELRPWYLSLAATGPDEQVATALEEAADQIRRRRGRSAALRLARRSAELSNDSAARARRLVAAATDALTVGDTTPALRWCREAAALGEQASTVPAVLVLGRALAAAGRLDEAYDTLLRAATDPATEPGARAALRAEATVPAVLAGDVDRAGRAAPALTGTTSPRARALVGCVRILQGDIGRFPDPAAGEPGPVDAETAAHLCRGLLWAERFDQARPVVNRAVDDARRDGAAPDLALSLAVRAELETWTGHWATASADAEEAVSWAEELGMPPLLGHALAVLSRLDALRGDHRACAEHVERARREAGPSVLGWLGAQLAAAEGLSALGRGEPEAAIEHLEATHAAAQRYGLGNPVALPIGADLAEAYLRCGRLDRAAGVGEWLAARATASGLAWPATAAARCAGLAARTEEAAHAAFARAHGSPALAVLPFERGRTLLAEGEVLRRLRRPLAARTPLRAAEALFEALGAVDWARRCRSELAAAGAREPAAVADVRIVDSLTPQELQIARLVAAGHNNVEAAAALFVSRKTVEAHLTRVYRKLTVRSRTDLARVLHAQGVLE
jgi:DNA-binding CsgD family transcriptional regulator